MEQSQLATGKTELGSLGAGTLLPANLTGLSLSPGVYTILAGTSNLTGTLTLNGQDNLNAFWVFQMPRTLIPSPGSVVNAINMGSGAGVYWNVSSSATLDTTASFEGNTLALTSITRDTGATDQCGRTLAHTGAVTMDEYPLHRVLWHSTPIPLPVSTAESGTVLLLGSELASFVCMMRIRR